MSIAGIRSNRGDIYQTLVAFDWALTVLSDPDYQWLEVDSISYVVDDVVIGKTDGTRIACQCKKNQVDCKAWTIADLADEVDKASRCLINMQDAEIRFYSRNNFGALAKLREHSATQDDEASYQASLGKELRTTDLDLSERLITSTPSLSTYEFLRRTKFVTSDEFDRMEILLRERLRSMVSNPDTAFTTLWTRLDQLGARMSGGSTSAASQHRLTKDDLKVILHKAGAILVPPMNLAEIHMSFIGTSAIGRSWRRDIGGQRLSSSVVNDLLAAIDSKKRSILLTGLPGSGKTCVMLALQEVLEERAKTRSDIAPLFIQSREFADLASSIDRQAQGLPEQWVEKVARMADNVQVIVVIDSLDVLSIARDHRVLTYFLAQIDRLLLISNVVVVTACRGFDRHYDRRIAERKWECELQCQPLVWDTEIEPILQQLGIATGAIDEVTRELIRNPRELALFVELAMRGGSFNVVTSQALAQRYLDTLVRANDELGDAAVQAIEAIALEMLKLRSLAVPRQRFNASQDIQRKLCSLNVLQETKDGRLTFGHQTLLDVLVISGAVRIGVSLNEFINGLPPVPFVRPSIRSFIAQLALGERREFRKQLRTVLTGSAAFHIRRLVAESFSEQRPQDDDWYLIRDLREKHRDVFQVIYTCALAAEWHYFWLKHLVPFLKMAQDGDGLAAHVHRIAQWSDIDSAGVLSFWMDVLLLDYVDRGELANRIGVHLSEVKSENLKLAVPLLRRLLDMPRPQHSFLGRILARCVSADLVEDALLWNYITDGVSDEELLEFRFHNKLRCESHEFDDQNDDFLRLRIERSSALLDLVLGAVVRWSEVRASQYGDTRVGYRHGFLGETSYEDAHSRRDIHHVDSIEIVLDAIESAILHHARTNSDWWRTNRERLCFNHEGALLYFAIQACADSPEANVDVIGRMLCDKNMLEFELNYELGGLLQSAFRLLDAATQDIVMARILTVWDEVAADELNHAWVIKARAELIASIPSYMRSPEVQAVLDAYEKETGVLIREPSIRSSGGMVCAPFSFEVFLGVTDGGILRLLEHYDGYSNWQSDGRDFLLGGEREVGWQLREASSRSPTRFLSMILNHWEKIPDRFREDIMEGVAAYLAHRYGNLQTNGAWSPIEEPDAQFLATQILDELERHSTAWRNRRPAAKALEACANVIEDAQGAERLIRICTGFEELQEADPIKGDRVKLIDLGINMIKGEVVEALMILANKFLERAVALPESLAPALRNFAGDPHPAVRALILRRLPYLQSKEFELGWDLFHLAMQDADGLWETAEPCLYFAYHNYFEVVELLLARLRSEGSDKDLETWGRISALAAMTRHISFGEFLEDLNTLGSTEAWLGAATVWTNAGNIRQHRDQCIFGMRSGLNSGGVHAKTVATQMDQIFRERAVVISIPIELVRHCFSTFENNSEEKYHRLFGFHAWLNATSQLDPELALSATEIYLAYVSRSKPYLHDHENSLTQLMTRLFAEAEEREESDCGVMLQRVVTVQDTLLSLGLNGVVDWLKAAERP